MEHGHSGHAGHGMPIPSEDPMPAMCSMNMLWNNDVENVCVVFKSWHVRGPLTMILSCLVIFSVAILYSFLLHQIKRLDIALAYSLHADSKGGSGGSNSRRESMVPRRESLIPPIPNGYNAIETGSVKMGVTKLPFHMRITRAALYAISVAISFWLMLVAMTYNTFLFTSIIIGAFVGHVLYEGEIDVGAVLGGAGSKGLACH